MTQGLEEGLSALESGQTQRAKEILERLRKAGALGASMTGSGACCFGLFPTEEEAVRAAPAFSDLPFSAVCRS